MKSAESKKRMIEQAGLSIYEAIEPSDSKYFTNKELNFLLKNSLLELSTKGLPNRTRSKFVKTAICESLGYQTPSTFKKTKPRFPGQNFDTYVQKSSNLQIWNAEISDLRRYVIIKISELDTIVDLRVINGKELKTLDTTGTLTKKFQARVGRLNKTPTIFSKSDTTMIKPLLCNNMNLKLVGVSPMTNPSKGKLLSLANLIDKIKPIIGFKFSELGRDQERNRGTILHKKICELLGYSKFEDNGQFPDIRHQLLEVKLQTSLTIDLGLALPNSKDTIIKVNSSIKIRHCDIRYVVVIGQLKNGEIRISNFALGAGADFFRQFLRFEGKVVNKKIQIPLPKDFFNS